MITNDEILEYIQKLNRKKQYRIAGEQILRRALVKMRLVIPQTDEEVDLFEASGIPLLPVPDALSDPFECLNPSRQQRREATSMRRKNAHK